MKEAIAKDKAMITLHYLFVLGVCFSIVGGFCGFTPIIWPIEKRRNLFSLQIQKLSNEKKEDTNRWKVLKPVVDTVWQWTDNTFFATAFLLVLLGTVLMALKDLS